MKSFADWTQELAESVGEVKHHWEEPSADSNAPVLDFDSDLDDKLDAIFGDPLTATSRDPKWQARNVPGTLSPAQPVFPHCTRSPTAECEDCHVTFSCLLDEWESPCSGNHYRMCVNCASKNGYIYVPPNPNPANAPAVYMPAILTGCDNYCGSGQKMCCMYSPPGGGTQNYRLCDECHTNHFPSWKRV